MRTARDFAKETGALCVGAVAFAVGDPSGGTLLATPITALAALGLTLRSGCAEKACARAEAQILKLLAQNPEYTPQEIDRARAILKDAPSIARLDPKAVAAIAETDLETDLSEAILATLAIGTDDGKVRDIVRIALVAGIACVKTDAEFRGALTLELVLETARKAGVIIAKLDRIEDKIDGQSRILAEVREEIREINARRDSDPERALDDLRDIASELGERRPHRMGWEDLVEYCLNKAADLAARVAEYEKAAASDPDLGNLSGEVARLLSERRFRDAEKLFDDVLELGVEEDRRRIDRRAVALAGKAEIALQEDRVDGAYELFCRAADSFRAIDQLEAADRRDLYRGSLYRHGLRYGGQGLTRTIEIMGPAISAIMEGEEQERWGAYHNNLGNARANQGTRTGGPEGARLLGEAVEAYRAALSVRTEADHPAGWALTQNNLGNALANQGTRTGGTEGTRLLGEAVKAYHAAHVVYTEGEHPVNWAMTLKSLALAEESIADHDTTADPRPHLEAALAHIEAALTVYDPEHMSHDHGTATRLRDRLAARLAGLDD